MSNDQMTGLLRQAASSTAQWHQPLHLSHHRARLMELVDTSADNYPEPFVYVSPDTRDRHDLLREASALTMAIDPPELAELVAEHIDHAQRSLALAEHRDDSRYAAYQAMVTGLPEPQTITAAQAILAEPHQPVIEDPTISPGEMQSSIRELLDDYKLADSWSVGIYENMAARMSINPARRLIRVRAAARFTPAEGRRLMAHEVGGHVLRTANALTQAERLAIIPLGTHPLVTEEGLALVVEEQLGVQSFDTLRTYALRVVAVQAAQTHGILEVARQLRMWTGTEQAVEIAIRAKRGLSDPNLPGGATRDHSYLQGYLTLRTWPSEHLDLLRTVKWSHHHLELLQHLAQRGDLTSVVYRPDDRLKRRLRSCQAGMDAKLGPSSQRL